MKLIFSIGMEKRWKKSSQFYFKDRGPFKDMFSFLSCIDQRVELLGPVVTLSFKELPVMHMLYILSCNSFQFVQLTFSCYKGKG